MDEMNVVTLKLSSIEKIQCLREIDSRLKKILYVYEKSMEPNSKYNYKIFCSGLAIYISSSNVLFNGELVNLVVNMNAILTNNFEKSEIKRITFESINFVKHLISVYTIAYTNECLSNKEEDKIRKEEVEYSGFN